ncbi:hypothetical protein [Endozoicomonas acroporae]|uniref:hypothetical protein n=1 Tax=Endozoicomonas acroporae TaxID=1701104 RepID=UPI003D7A3F2D
MSLIDKRHWGLLIAGALSASVSADPVSQEIRYTYHPSGTLAAGQLASVDGPRTDVSDITRFEWVSACKIAFTSENTNNYLNYKVNTHLKSCPSLFLSGYDFDVISPGI